MKYFLPDVVIDQALVAMESVFLEFLQIVLARSHQVEVPVVVNVPFFLNSVLLVRVQS